MKNYKINMVTNEEVAFYHQGSWSIADANFWTYGFRSEILIRAVSLNSELLEELYRGTAIYN